MIRISGLILAVLLVAPQKPETGKIKSTFDKSADFAAFQTYTWLKGQPANDRATHTAIVAAVDSELSALGLRKVESGSSDVTVRYMAVRSSYVDLDKIAEIERKGGDSREATHSVGRRSCWSSIRCPPGGSGRPTRCSSSIPRPASATP
jgi:hypothetical protein